MSRMSRIHDFTASKDEILTYPTPQWPSPPPSSPSSSLHINPAILLTIVILAAIFFVTGLIHLLIRFFTKQTSSPSIYLSSSTRYAGSSGASHALQRQLHQLFRLHDTGLDQTSIDALPVFYYKHIIGLKEPSDCAVCLCEFSHQDKLRLLPNCSHAFHIQCIDTWLLSNSSCPLCRGSIVGSEMLDIINEEELDSAPPTPKSELDFAVDHKRVVNRVFSVRLGKFRSFNNEQELIRDEEGSCRYLDSRRCYSMGSYQYIVGDLDLQVAYSCRARQQQSTEEGRDEEGGKRINGRWSRSGDSFSISKIWLWPKNSSSRLPRSLPDMPY